MTTVHRQMPATLWERRKIEAMSRIQRVALDLFEEHGYREVTVERVAAAAEVSPSSIYRYFGTKEMLVLYDESDPRVLEVLRTTGDGEVLPVDEMIALAKPLVAPMLAALLTPDAERRIARRLRLMRAFPEVKDGQAKQMRELEEQFRALFAERSGREANDLQVRMIASIVVWGGVSALEHWAAKDFDGRLSDVYAEAVASIIRAIEAVIG
ncbi:TetR/AcrR family transcriptional regulator [Nocardia puris]|uniref:TetR/AcrR family transcriptional regulator n=1 Tax=Nocardia puris TaxID=208602 RepID=UPI001895E48E|nr:TetR/AcrR family transcriptional regulator [Nocardia puris]MBF6213325.1 TetR/AcrR family transcriptional regulator [Nocardia puris]MBF6369507.1 TetR/AcrR family transcriptional regulator [Nocardia puris]MBF6462204.1 TetR/AcrR family transcriptional regulator [Nocardia puris]